MVLSNRCFNNKDNREDASQDWIIEHLEKYLVVIWQQFILADFTYVPIFLPLQYHI